MRFPIYFDLEDGTYSFDSQSIVGRGDRSRPVRVAVVYATHDHVALIRRDGRTVLAVEMNINGVWRSCYLLSAAEAREAALDREHGLFLGPERSGVNWLNRPRVPETIDRLVAELEATDNGA